MSRRPLYGCAPSLPPNQWLVRQLAIDRRALAAFRVALGLCLLVDIALRYPDVVAFYIDSGMLPRSTLTELYPVLGDVSPLARGLLGYHWWPSD